MRREEMVGFVFYFILLCHVSSVTAWLSWFSLATQEESTVGGDATRNKNNKVNGDYVASSVVVPFELKTADEKFLLEGKNHGIQLSALDICHHKVVMHLKTSCSKLTEEEIGKLSVHLLNCQSAVEGRPTYPCTDEMTLRQCTESMDQDTWNTYHIVSNRARAVCYTARQQQFTAKTEMTVNRLVWASEQQLQSLQQLEEGQERVRLLTTQTLDTTAAGQRELMLQHEKLKTSQSAIQTFVVGNLRELTKEKALIAAGQKELSSMTEMIKMKLDHASGLLAENEEQRQANHKEIMEDLKNIQDKARDVWEKIDNSTQRILRYHLEASLQFEHSLKNLEKINGSISYLLDFMQQTRNEVDKKLGWVASYLSNAGDQMAVVYCCIVHGAFFLVTILVVTSLQVPMASRIITMVLIPLNAFSEVKQGSSLNFVSLSVLIVICVLSDWIIQLLRYRYKRRQNCFLQISNQPFIHQSTVLTSPVPGSSSSVQRQDYQEQQEETSLVGDESIASRILTPVKASVSGLLRRRSQHRQDADAALADSSNGSVLNVSHHNSFNEDAPGTSTPVTQRASSRLGDTPLSATKGRADVIRRDLFSYLEQSQRGSREPSPSPSVVSSTNSSRRAKVKCQGTNKSGTRCKMPCMFGDDYCRYHSPS